MSVISKVDPARTYLARVLAAFWLLIAIGGLLAVLHYSNVAGRAGAAPAHWPAGSQITPAKGMAQLLIFAHPRCPCTRATLGELEILMAQGQGRVAAQVWFIRPAGMIGDWTRTDLWSTAATIPGVTVHEDVGRDEARRFHAETSGQTLLYDAAGNLMFEGGITISRGHSGGNPGRDAVAALLEKPVGGCQLTPVFGCPLFENSCQEEGMACKR